MKSLVATLASDSMNGPSSTNSPKKLEAPGPPFVQSSTGSFTGSFSDSMNM